MAYIVVVERSELFKSVKFVNRIRTVFLEVERGKLLQSILYHPFPESTMVLSGGSVLLRQRKEPPGKLCCPVRMAEQHKPTVLFRHHPDNPVVLVNVHIHFVCFFRCTVAGIERLVFICIERVLCKVAVTDTDICIFQFLCSCAETLDIVAHVVQRIEDQPDSELVRQIGKLFLLVAQDNRDIFDSCLHQLLDLALDQFLSLYFVQSFVLFQGKRHEPGR